MANILGINITELNKINILKKTISFLDDNKSHYIVTPNPEIILNAQKDEELFYILNKADLSIADGYGVELAARLYGTKIERLSGADLLVYLLNKAEQDKLKVVILNWSHGLSSKKDLDQALKRKFPQLNFKLINIEKEKFLKDKEIDNINNYQAKLLFVTLGAPEQEKLIFHNLKKLSTVSIAIGVGGAFDFITKKTIRAPKKLRQLGLEWLWRLIQQPQRWHRIYQATIVFSREMLKNRFINPFQYRDNVACLLYKKDNKKIKVLIVEREDESQHWQIPQGGTDGESIAQAGARELREELNTSNFITRASFKNLYRYKFPKNIIRDKEKEFKKNYKLYKYSYRGQKQGLYIAEFKGQDNEIKVNFWDHTSWRWVEIDKLLESVYPVRRKGMKIFLNKFKTLEL